MRGISSSRRRSGPTTWELAHLWLNPDDASDVADLFSLTCQLAARRGCHRIFARLRKDDSLVGDARKAGFTHCVDELLYRRSGRKPAADAARLGVRARSPADDYNLFRLYNASTPAEVRTTVGMTFDQWRHSKERSRKSSEFVLESGGQLVGWLRINRSRQSAIIEIAAHPEHRGSDETLLGFALDRLQTIPSVSCLVGSYQFGLQSLLVESGFAIDQEFVTLARPMVISERTPERRHAVTVASF